MPKALSYIRFSSTLQKQGDSLRRQNDLINKWILDNPDTPLSDLQFKDLGKSGFHGKHLDHGFGQLLAAIEKEIVVKGDILLVEAIDRLGRLEPSEMMELLMGIVNSGVTIITLEDGISYDKQAMREGGIYILSGKIQGAHAHSDKLSKRIKASWDNKRKKAEDGLGVNRKSFWYITKDKHGKYNQITPKDKVLVTKIYTMYLSGVSLNKIASFMRDHDPVRFKTYSATGLKKMLINKTAIGYWEDTPNAYEPAIEEQLFYSVQNLITSRTKGKKQGGASKHIMAGLVACKRCGKNYTVRNQKHSATVMYCTASNKGECDNTSVIPMAILNEFRVRTQNAYIQKIIDSKVNNDSQKLVVALDGKIATLKTSIDNLVALVEAGSKSGVKKTIELESRLEELELERIGLVATEPTTVNIQNLKQAGLDMSTDPLILNGMLKQVGYKIMVDDKTMTLGDDQLTYVKYVKTSANQGAYEVSVFGNLEYIKKPKDDLTVDEKVNALIKATSGKKIHNDNY
jgi:DNA invertase Pin-like site-specific DNA recombinase